LECEICKLLINELDKFLITNATTEKIEEAVTKFCDSLPAEIKAFVSIFIMATIIQKLSINFNNFKSIFQRYSMKAY
jgi:hypothetical protein